VETRVAPGRNYTSGLTRALDADLGLSMYPPTTRCRTSQRSGYASPLPIPSRGRGTPSLLSLRSPHAPGDLWSYLDAGEDQLAFTCLVGTVTEHADLVVIDHRGGLGCAYPKLPALPVREPMPFGRRVELDEREEHYRRFFQKQIDYWREAEWTCGT